MKVTKITYIWCISNTFVLPGQGKSNLKKYEVVD